MLVSLIGVNFYFFKKINIEFSRRMNVISGESGAGKSIILRAIKALIGEPPEYKPEGESFVEGVFYIKDFLRKKLLSKGYDFEKEDYLLINVNFSSGRIIYRINGRIIPRLVVKEIFSDVVEIHSQFDSVGLLNVNRHYLILDKPFKNENFYISYLEKYTEYLKVSKALNNLEINPEEIEKERDYIEYQIDEINKANINPGRDNEIQIEYKKLQRIKQIQEILNENAFLINDDDISILSTMEKILNNLSRITDVGYEKMYEKIKIVEEDMLSIYNEIQGEIENLSTDEEKLFEFEERINIIQNLKRKYGNSIEKILEYYAALIKKRERFNFLQNEKDDLEKKKMKLQVELKNLGSEISKRREKISGEIEDKINEEFVELKMKGASLKFNIIEQDEPKHYGTSRVNIMVKTNPGNDFRNIEKIASGGELSRILLSLESVLKDSLDVSTIIFDEIDSGVGQRLADTLGQKLFEISESVQSVVVTHLPQVAKRGDKHFIVKKIIKDHTTESVIYSLDGEERKREIYEMAGKK